METYTKFNNIAEIINTSDKEKIELIKRILEVNNNLFDNLYIEFFNSDWFLSFDFNMLVYITTIENTQKSLLKFTEKEKNLFLKLINLFSREYYYPPYFAALLNSIDKENYSEFIKTIPEIDRLSEEELRNISLLLTSKKNYLNIKNYNEFKNIDFNKLIEQSKNNIEEYKNIKLIQITNLSLEEVKVICSKYCYDIEKIECKEKQSLIDFLRILKRVVLSTDINEIDNLLNFRYRKIEYPNLQSIIQNLFVTLYNKELFDVQNKSFKEVEGVKVFDAGLAFKMIVRSNGAFNSEILNWNSNIRNNYSFSNSFISNNRLNYYGLQKSGLITLGFNNLKNNSIVENCLGDNATIHNRKYTLDPRSYDDFKTPNKVTGDGCGQFFSTIDSINNFATTTVHTEITLERFYEDENGYEKRVQPSYVVYYIYNDEYEKDTLYIDSIKYAKDLNIPLVTVDVKKVLLNEKIKFENKYKECMNSLKISDIEELFYLYANNYVEINRVCDNAKEIYKDFFSLNIMDDIISSIFFKCEAANKPKDFYQKLFDKLMIINEPKRIISVKLLYKLYKKYNLEADTIYYTKKLEGILPTGEIEKSEFYDFDNIIELEKICNKYSILISDEILNLAKYKLNFNIKILEKYGIPITEDTVVISGNQIDRNIQLCMSKNIEWTIDIIKIKDYQELKDYVDLLLTQNSQKDKTTKETIIYSDDEEWVVDSFFDEWLEDFPDNDTNTKKIL